MPLIVVSAGPGAGKTTLLPALQGRGRTIVGETARSIIQDRRRRGLNPRAATPEFVREVMRRHRHPCTPRRAPRQARLDATEMSSFLHELKAAEEMRSKGTGSQPKVFLNGRQSVIPMHGSHELEAWSLPSSGSLE